MSQISSSQNGLGKSRAVFLVGFMGAGKTTVGTALATRLRWKFVDLDALIVAAAGKSIPAIFKESGEDAFREHETSALRYLLARLSTDGPTVVALGGGAFVQPANLNLIREALQPTVFLDAAIEELLKRCAPAMESRPLFRDKNQFRQLYECRRSGYMEADIRVDTARKSVAEIVNEVISRLGLEDDFR